MLTITPAYKTEDGKTFDRENQALIYAAIKASGVYLDYCKDLQLAEELDKLIIVYEREEEKRALKVVASIFKEEEEKEVKKDEKSDMAGLRSYIQSRLDSADEEFFPKGDIGIGFKAALEVVLASMKLNGY